MNFGSSRTREMLGPIRLLLMAMVPAGSWAAQWYVAPTGSDQATGTAAAPFRSIQRAVDAARPGDRVTIGAGLYVVSAPVRIASKRGSPELPISVVGEGMPTILAAHSRVPGVWGGLVEVQDSSYIHLKGLSVVGSGFFGFRVQRSRHVELLDNRSTISLASGIWVSDSTAVRIEGNDVSRFCDRTQFGADGRTGCQEGISLEGVDGFSVLRNRVHDAPQLPEVTPGGGEGIDVKQGSMNGSVEGNEVWNLPQLGIYVDAYSRGVSNVKVHANRVWNTRQGIVISSERGGLAADVEVSHNLVHDVGYHGILISDFNKGRGGDGPRRGILIHNNTIVDAGVKEAKAPSCHRAGSTCVDGGVGIRVDTANITGLEVHDNIIVGARTAPMVVNPVVQQASRIERNLLWPAGPGRTSGEYHGVSPIFADPRLRDPAGGDYRLRADSPARGVGVGGSSRHRDLRGVLRPLSPIDLGALAFEGD
ncbi:MAG: right-handed parallel beta-helix repeat-containing protein [Burkholderiales bacterium]|nr:right-handed parallel beta-helix repeat-containing protein [Burkholderiales bacterium]